MDVSHKRVQSTIVVNPYQMQTVEGEKGENDKFYTSPPKKSLRILGVQKPKASNFNMSRPGVNPPRLQITDNIKSEVYNRT
jgi:hypothetical protein